MPEAQQEDWPVSISTSNTETGATLIWRRKERLYLTAVVKATFALVPGGTMTLCQPEPVARDEQEHAAGLRSAGDLAPFRRRADVVITGHGVLPPGPPGTGLPVRFMVLRDGATVLDKSTSIQVPTWTSGGLVRLFGLGPLSRRWPIRARLVEGHDVHLLEGTSLDLPPAFDESYFQVAPVDQRVDMLHGDEQIAFDGARADGTRIESLLPGVRAVARLHGPAEEGRSATLDLKMDLLHVDLEKWVCNVTWRGFTRVAREEDLPAMRVIAAIELAPARLERKSLPPPKPPPKRSALSAPPEPGTQAAPRPFDGLFRPPPLPDPAAAQPSVRPRREEATATIVLPDGFTPAGELPFSPARADAAKPQPKPAHAISDHAVVELDSIDIVPDVEPVAFDRTMEVSHRAVLAAPAMPFVRGTPTSAPPDVPPPMLALPPLAPEPYAGPPHDVSPWATGVAASRPPPAPVHPTTVQPIRPATPEPSLAPVPEPIRPPAPTLTSEAPSAQRAPVPRMAAVAPPAGAPRTGTPPPGAMTFGAHYLAAMEAWDATRDRA